MITIHHIAGRAVDAGVTPDQAIDILRTGSSPVWIDVADPSADELHAIASHLSFHPLDVEDVTQGRQRPRVAQYENHLFVVLHEMEIAKTTGAVGSGGAPIIGRGKDVYVFLGSSYFVTIHRGESPMIAEAIGRWQASEEMQRKGPLIQLYMLLDSIVDEYISALDDVNDGVADLEEMVVTGADNGSSARQSNRTPRDMITEMLKLRRSLLEMRRSISHMRDAVNILLRKVESLGADEHLAGHASTRECFAYYQDVYDHTMRIADTLDTYRDILGGVLDAHLAVASNRLNEVVKVLTSVSIILMSLAMISGIYGMNFAYMPELHWKYGYAYALGLMVAVTVGLWLYFRRRRWI